MSLENDEKKFRRCVRKIIELINQCIQELKPTTEQRPNNTNDDDLLRNSQLNNNVHTFSISKKENELLDRLTANIEETLDRYIPDLSPQSWIYMLNFLNPHQYDQKTKKFTSSLTMDGLYSFERAFQSLLASVDAYPAAYNGDKEAVQKFIENYPNCKDKPGPWETTLLYSAARNNHFELVTYLVETAHCDVNAQNQRDADFALNTCKPDFTPKPTAGSTALHAACYNKHLKIIKYLLEHNANYFIQNQANETPIMNGEKYIDIRNYFADYLITNYSIDSPRSLPNQCIMSDNRRPIRDCIWEYKPFQDPKWYIFTSGEVDLLHKPLLPTEQFEKQVYLKVAKGLYSVTMADFCRSGRHEQDPQKNMAWVRCRGSSILNFDCYSLWQIMIIQHDKTTKDTKTTPLLKVLHFPTTTDSRFRLQLNTWYTCDAKVSSSIEDSMNYRRKIIKLNVPFVGDQLTFNLQTFEFSSDAQKIVGHIRWIPKLVSHTELNGKRIVPVDNYHIAGGIQPIPLTTKHHKECSHEKKSDRSDTDNLVNAEDDNDEDEDEDESALQIASNNGLTNDDNIDDDDIDRSADQNKISLENTTGTYSVADMNGDHSTEGYNQSPTTATTTTTDDMTREKTDISIDDYFEKNASESEKSSLKERTNSTLKDETTEVLTCALESEIKELKEQIEQEKLKVKELEKSKEKLSTEKETKLERTNEQLRDLQKQLVSRQRREQELQDLSKQIKCIDYENVETMIAQHFIYSKQKQIVQHLKTRYKINNYFVGIPNLTIIENNEQYSKVSVIGVREHHDEFKPILQRLRALANATQLAKEYYQRRLNATLRSMNYIMIKQIPYSQDWRAYVKYFQQLIQNKIEEYSTSYNKYITHQAKEIVENCINDASFQASIPIRKLTTRYMKENPLESEIEALKYEALEEFIKQHVFSERLKYEKKPSATSLQVLNEFIDAVKNEFRTNPIYDGCQREQLREIPKLLQRIMLYYRSFLLQLPLYESAKDLLKRIQNNTVITISTSTGSGKSSLLPALLIAEGYEKVIVTQPRRLPCTAICQRVNQTMLTHPKEPKLAGWAVSGDECDVKAPILYLTDGLLKERLLHDENFISNQTKVDKPIVFFIDEVHERSVNIDLCLALFARLLTEKSHLKSKIKIIISSATLDSSVPQLFRQIPQIKVDEFKMPLLGTLYPVAIFKRPNQNILDLVQELCKKRQRHDQILCFVSSVAEVKQCCRLLDEISRGTLTAYELIQSQSANDQQKYIEQGSIFFSTTVAETSLTFPSLKYVIDTGRINIPVYNSTNKQTTLMEIEAAQSTIKQRLGRLGRTQPGEYYSLYDFNPEEKKYPTPQICQSELVNIEFSLRKSSIKNGLNYMKKFLPDPPSANIIDAAIEELKRLRLLDAKEKLTSVGVSISKLPDFGSLAMAKAVDAALNQYNCGRDLIVLSSILGVLNTSSVLKLIPNSMKSADGDFMSLLNVMNEILLIRESVRPKDFKLWKVCQAKGLTAIQHVLRQALRRYESLERAFVLSDEYREKAQVSNGNWEIIAQCLLRGYNENVFLSMKELQGKTHIFTRYSPPKQDFAVLDLQSTLTRAVTTAPVALVLARDIRFSSSIRATAVLSFVGEIQSQWIDYTFRRLIKLNTNEETKLHNDNILATAKQIFSNVKIQLNNHELILEGSAGSVLDAELDILRQLVEEMKFTLANQYSSPESAKFKLMKQNLESVAKMPYIFNPMKWRWEAQHQVKITVNNSTNKDESEITIEGRDSQNQLVLNEFQSFLGWLKMSAVMRHPNAGVSPRILKPQMRKTCMDIEEKISHITDSKRTSIELWKSLKGAKATRETRMEVVAWIAVCKFDCRVEGGFVRDWIVGNYLNKPTSDPSTWVTYSKTGIPYLDKEFIPSDLDCHLSANKYFDIDKFLDQLHKYGIECKVSRENWRYVLLLDECAKTGPFTMDLIEPHVALTHDRIDLDVSNLSLEKDYTKELGMRVDIQSKPYSIELETIVHNIKNKRFQVLRPVDNQVQERIDKMIRRGWTQFGQPMHVIPNPPPKCDAILVPLPESTELYKLLVQQMKNSIGEQLRVLSIEQIKNPSLEDAYLAMRQLIAKECPGHNPNERELFHGTKGEAIDGIVNKGYDDRFWRSGKWGHGAYFAHNPAVSNGYTSLHPTYNTHIMYYNKVTLGKESIVQELNQALMSAPQDYHSTHGTFVDYPDCDEYIVYRYGQAMPYLKITYTV